MSKSTKANPLFGERLKKQRKRKNLTREQLAGKIDVSKSMIYKYEVGENRIKEDISELLAAKLDCDSRYFTDESFKYPTREDEFAAIMKKHNKELAAVIDKIEKENYYMNLAIISLLKLNGYEVKINPYPKSGVLGKDIPSISGMLENYFVVSKDGKELFTLSEEKLNLFGNNLDKTFNVLLSYYLK